MRYSELVKRVGKARGLPSWQAKLLVDTVFDEITKTLQTFDDVKILNFGTFRTDFVPARTQMHPGTGEKIRIPNGWMVRFKPAGKLRERVWPKGKRR